MSQPDGPVQRKTFAERMMSVPRTTLFAILVVATSVPLFFTIKMPNKPADQAIDFFGTMMSIPEGSTILIESDWTNSTRGESRAEMETLIRILSRRKLKAAIYGCDPQAPQVVRDLIADINEERVKKGQPEWKRWDDWVNLGFYPNAEAIGNSIAADITGAFSGKTDVTPDGKYADVYTSPVLANIKKLDDIPVVVVVTASNTSNVVIERLSGKAKSLCYMVTGVMGPETAVYYASGQLKGLASGLKGAYDMETMMEVGLNEPPDKPVVKTEKYGPIPGFSGEQNYGKGALYYPTLHVALTLLILAIVVGNIGMILAKKQAAAQK